jgi:hypothetical protein
MYSEVEVDHQVPLPPGYRFLAKGNRYKTLHCRKATLKASMTLYVVKKDKKPIGIRVPIFVIHQVTEQAVLTLPARTAATAQRDKADADKATAELKNLFPNMPNSDLNKILNHGFRKYSSRVGRSGKLSLRHKAILAVQAHIRHQHTSYEKMLKGGNGRKKARKATYASIQGTMQSWGFTEGKHRCSNNHQPFLT